MPAWRDHNLPDLLALADIVAGFSREIVAGADNGDEADTAMLAVGATLYASHCIQCHGSNGRGDGFAAASFGVAAVDFTLQRPSLQQGLAVLENGISGTPMAQWSDRLDAAERRAVVLYIRSFFDEAEAGDAD